jgi:hypothetical protein
MNFMLQNITAATLTVYRILYSHNFPKNCITACHSHYVSLTVYIVQKKYCMANHIASFAILVYDTHCKQNSITEHYHSVQKLSFYTSVTNKCSFSSIFWETTKQCHQNISYVPCVTLSLTCFHMH